MRRAMGCWGGLVAAVALLAVGTATAADLSELNQPTPFAQPAQADQATRVDSFRDRFEFRFGVGAHGVGSVESGTVDLNGEFLFPQLRIFSWPSDPAWSWLVPRFAIGGNANLGGRTSYAYTDLVWTYDLTDRLFLEGYLGGAIHNGSLAGDAANHEAALGCRALFHVGASLGYWVTSHWNLMVTFAHLSNGKAVLDACSRNQGLNQYMIRAGYSF